MMRVAANAGVQHIIYVGSFTVIAPNDLPELSSRFMQAEALLKELGTRWTSLRSGFFFSNYASLFSAGLKDATVEFPNLGIAGVDPRDIGRVASAIVLDGDNQKHPGKCYDISGPEILKIDQVVERISRAIGKHVTFRPIAAEKLTYLPKFLLELFIWMQKTGDSAVPFSDDPMRICGTQTSFDTWLEEHKHDFQ
jgi:uncharacterized protein YbjT (DUF2867 family)